VRKLWSRSGKRTGKGKSAVAGKKNKSPNQSPAEIEEAGNPKEEPTYPVRDPKNVIDFEALVSVYNQQIAEEHSEQMAAGGEPGMSMYAKKRKHLKFLAL